MRVVPAALAVLLTAAQAAPARAQDFDPHGHRRPHAPTPGPGPRRQPAPAEVGGDVAGAPSQDVLIDRYTSVVLAQPGTALPLERLAGLCRARDGGLQRVISEFEARAAQAGPTQHASVVALAGLYELAGRAADAVTAYQNALALKGGDANTLLALARLYEERADLPEARARYEEALRVQTARADKEQTLRTLMGLALDAADWDAAKRFHKQLVELEPTSLFVRGELGRELYRRAEYARAEEELEDVVIAAAGDNRALAPALKELGEAQAKAHQSRPALATLQKALAAAGAQSALRAEIYEVIAGIYRADQQLPALVRQLESEHPADTPRLALLGGLYEETGDSARAIDTYRRALSVNPRQIDLRLRMIRLLQSNGDLDRAIAEYDALIRTTPNNPQFVFEECETLLQRGDRPRALRLMTDLEARVASDDEALSRVADFYTRIGEGDKALRVLQHLAASSAAGDGSHLVDLGDRYFQDGNVPLALQTWKKILGSVQPRSRALAALGDVLLEHDMASDAVAAYREAAQLEPTNLQTKKALAGAYERLNSFKDARLLYEEILKKATRPADKQLARDCRSQIVTLWRLERTLDRQVPELKRRFGAAPPDVDAGKMLAEALLHLRRLPEAEQTLRQIVARVPGDTEAYLSLERVLVQQERIADALVVLETLAQLEPKRARELYQRMAQYALQIYRDEDAVRYAVRAVELNPDDAEGHRRLAELYRSKQDVDHAITEFRAAIAKNDRLFVVYFELADLLLAKGRALEADRLLRAVVRGAPDEELVSRAARLSMQINLSKDTLELLEDDLLPLAISNPQRKVYRRLLVEVCGNLTFGMAQRVRHGSESEARNAREALSRVGSRAIKPLLDALADDDLSQQRIAIDVLTYVQNRHAALPLFTFATGRADLDLRARAMVACGLLADASLVPKYAALLFPNGAVEAGPDVADSVGAAAVWGLSRIRDAQALRILRRVAFGDGPQLMRGLAVLGLGASHDSSSLPRVASLVSAPDVSTVVRGAAAHALGDLNAQGQVPALIELAEDGDALPRRMALVSLARLGAEGDPSWKPDAVRAMADAFFGGSTDDSGGTGVEQEAVSRAAVAALTILARGSNRTSGQEAADPLPLAESSLDVEALLDRLVPDDQTAQDREAALARYAEPLRRAALVALQTSSEGARRVLDTLGDGDGEFLPFVKHGTAGAGAQAARELTAALLPSIVPLAKHPDPELRARALRLLAQSRDDAAVDAIVAGLEDSSETVRRVALASLGAGQQETRHSAPIARAVGALVSILDRDANWAMRVLAAQALGRLGRFDEAGIAARLAAAAERDPYALVREASLGALFAFDPAGARRVARGLAAADPEPRVRQAASELAR